MAPALTARPVGLQPKPIAAAYLGINPRTLDRLVAAGLVKCVRPSPGLVRFKMEDLDEYIANLAK